jgi:hypothetical protein
MAAAIHESALSKASAMAITNDPAATRASGFKAGPSAKIAVNGQVAPTAIVTADFTHSAASIGGYATSTNLMDIADRFAASIRSTASRVSAPIVVCIVAAVVVVCIVAVTVVVPVIAAIVVVGVVVAPPIICVIGASIICVVI